MNAFDQLNAMLARVGPHNVVKVFGNYVDPNHLVFGLTDGSSESITLLGRRITASALNDYFDRRCPEAELNFYAYTFVGKNPRLTPVISNGGNISEDVHTYSELVSSIGGW